MQQAGHMDELSDLCDTLLPPPLLDWPLVGRGVVWQQHLWAWLALREG
jgi:hypothetical protein